MTAQLPPIDSLADVRAAFRTPPTTTLTAEQARRIRAMQRRASGEAVGSHSLDTPERFEPVEPTRGLTEGYRWFLPGLVYCLAGMDRSFLQLYRAGLREEVPVRSHRSDTLLLRFGGQTRSNEPWLYTVQGIPEEHWEGFRDFVASYQLKSAQCTWTCAWGETTMVDPFRDGAQLQVSVLLPKNHLTGRSFTVQTFCRVFPGDGVTLQVHQSLV